MRFNKKNLYPLLLFSLYFMLVHTVFADVSSDLTDYFNTLKKDDTAYLKVGENVNLTTAHAYKGQLAGYYTGGSLVARNSVRNLQIAEIDLPSLRAGCGGIDAFAGGFSFVNSDELVAVMRNVLNNAKGYAFTLALETVTPQIANTMKFMQDMANKVNQANINSCEMAEGLVDGLWSKTRAAGQKLCQEIAPKAGKASDWAAARVACTSSGANAILEAGSQDDQYKNLVFHNNNIAWQALQKMNLIAGDEELAELLMSLSGSIIIKTTDKGSTLKTLPSLANDPSLLKAILYGGTAMVYDCDKAEADNQSKKCLNPKRKELTIKDESGLKNQVSKLLASIGQKIISDEALDQTEIALLQSTRFPLYKILNVQAAYQKNAGILDVENDSEVVAVDILFQYLQESLALVHAASQQLAYPSEMMAEFNRGMEVALASIRAEQHHTQNQISIALQRVEQAQLMEQMLAGSFSTELSNHLEWGRGLH